MNIGELFINLGIKGADKTVGALTNVKKGLGEMKELSFEAKAGILAAMYALEKLFAASGAAGTGLTNFNALTGMSAKQLQQWQYAARQAGVAGDEMASSFKGVQGVMTNMLLGKGAPEGMAMLANKVGFDPKRARDTVYVLEQLQKFAQTVPKDVGNVALKSFGISEGVIAAMRRNAFNPGVMSKAPTYGDKEIATLDKANIAWSNLGAKIEMAVGHFNARHGLQLVHDISKITDSVLRLAEALTRMAEKMKVFEALGKVMNLTAEAIESKPGTFLGEKHGEKKIFNWMKEMMSPKAPNLEAPKNNDPYSLYNRLGPNGIAPPVSPAAKGGAPSTVNVQQNLNFHHDGQDHQKNAESHKKSVKDAYRQLQSQVQGS